MTNPPTTAVPEPRPGDILLFARPRRGRDYLIRWFTRSRFYHAAIYAGDWHIIEARPRGVARNDLRGREGDFLVLPAPGSRGAEALAWAQSKIGAGYDRIDMLVIVLEHIFTHLHLNYTPYNKFTCGEFVAKAYQEVGVRLVPNRDLDDVVPGDIARLLPADAQTRPVPAQ